MRKIYKIEIDVTGNIADGTQKGAERFFKRLKSQFVDFLPYRKGEAEIQLISIKELKQG